MRCSRFKTLVGLLAIVVVGLAGCGGSGSSTPPATTVSGVAATGAPIVGMAYLKDSAGVEKSQQINSNGSYSFVVDGLKAPFMLKAVWTPAGGTQQTLYSLAVSSGTANINPFSNLAIISAAGATDIPTLYSAPNLAILQALATAVPITVNALRTGPLKPLFDQYANIDPITDVFNANNTGFDKMLDNVTVTIAQGGSVTITNTGAGSTIFSCVLNTLGSGTFNQGNLPTTASTGGTTSTFSMKIAAGYSHTMAVKTDGTVWAWGQNGEGQLGDGTTINRLTPVQVKGLSNVIDIGSGDNTPIALKNDGTVWIWGRDWSTFNPATITMTDMTTPVQLAGLSQITAISAGISYGVGLKSDGTVWFWNSGHFIPSQLSGLVGIKAITSMYALKSDGTIWSLGIKGVTSADWTATPVMLSNFSGVNSIMQLGASYGSNQYALKTDGSIWSLATIPTQINNITTLTAIAGPVTYGGITYSAFVVKSDGTVWNWAANGVPVQITGLANIATITIGGSCVFALNPDGTVWAWGNNSAGQLGDGTVVDRTTPVQVSGLSLK